MIAVALVLAFSQTAAQPSVVGFTCTSSEGKVIRLSIDLKKGRYDLGEGQKSIARVSDTTITLDSGNPDLANTPMGRILHSLTLDRTTLKLIDQTSIPLRNVSRSSQFQCVKGEPIDFAAGRLF